jgi:hypothetical protein
MARRRTTTVPAKTIDITASTRFGHPVLVTKLLSHFSWGFMLVIRLGMYHLQPDEHHPPSNSSPGRARRHFCGTARKPSQFRAAPAGWLRCRGLHTWRLDGGEGRAVHKHSNGPEMVARPRARLSSSDGSQYPIFLLDDVRRHIELVFCDFSPGCRRSTGGTSNPIRLAHTQMTILSLWAANVFAAGEQTMGSQNNTNGASKNAL